MQDPVMVGGAVILGLLFLFLFSIFVIVLLTLGKRYPDTSFTPDISIVIPCYNEEKNIGACLDSIKKVAYKGKVEIIVVNDGSTDQTADVVTSHNSKPILVEGKHEGKTAALNLGAKKSTHDFIVTIDADTTISEGSLYRLVQPLKEPDVGATNGSSMVRNTNNMLTIFQSVEYTYNNLIRKGFSALFNNAIWFFGAFACYRKSVLKDIGWFKQHTLTEDMDIALEIHHAGHRIVNIYDAIGYTIAPSTIPAFFKQRTRWWLGVLQSLRKNKQLWSLQANPSILFLFVNQYWWTLYALLALPLIAYQYSYWLPYNVDSVAATFWYTFRWFTFLGPVHVLYMIPEWGISVYSIFGVLSGVISVVMILIGFWVFKHRITVGNVLAMFLYFPYTIILNLIIVLSVIRGLVRKQEYFKH